MGVTRAVLVFFLDRKSPQRATITNPSGNLALILVAQNKFLWVWE